MIVGRFLNDDYELTENSVKASKLTIDKLEELIRSKAGSDKETEFADLLPEVVQEAIDNSEYTIGSDIIEFMELRTLTNDLAFVGFRAYGEQDLPVYAIIYAYEDEIKLYVPIHGNNIDYTNKCALKSGNESDEYIKKYFNDTIQARINYEAAVDEMALVFEVI